MAHCRFLVPLLLAALTLPAHAQCPVEAAHAPAWESEGGSSAVFDRAQTFTLENAGLLVAVEIALYKTSDTGGVLVGVRRTVDGAPLEDNDASLGNGAIPVESIPGNSTPEFLLVDLSAFQIEVEAGDVLALVVLPNPYTDTVWIYEDGIDYAGGAAYARNLGPNETWQLSSHGEDFFFRTYVCPLPPVEPATWGAIKSAFE